MKWQFRVWIGGASEDDLLDWSNSLFKAGCDDSSPGTFEGRAHADFHRHADDLTDAIRSAVADIQRAGLIAERVEITTDEVALWPA